MRKDVILGMSIGGVMIAVVIVYLTVAMPNRPKSQVALDTGGTTVNEGGGETTEIDAHAPADSHELVHDVAPSPAPAVPAGPMASRADSRTASPAPSASSGTNWIVLLQTGQTTSTPDAAPVGGATPPARSAAGRTPPEGAAPMLASSVGGAADGDAGPGPGPLASTMHGDPHPAFPRLDRSADDGAAMTSVTPAPGTTHALDGATPTTNPGARIHRVQKNETLSTIAAAVYGSANLYPYIQRANPTVNPSRLKINQEIIIPDISEVRTPEAPHADAHKASAVIPPTAADPATEYTVVAGDSLHKISMTLYGNIANVDALYELNRTVIGPDPARLKVGMVLKKLPGVKTVGAGS